MTKPRMFHLFQIPEMELNSIFWLVWTLSLVSNVISVTTKLSSQLSIERAYVHQENSALQTV